MPAGPGRDGRRAAPRGTPSPKWLYDEQGSELSSAISGLPEYHPSEAERRRCAATRGESRSAPALTPVVELSSGTSDKTRTLLDAFWDTDQLRRCVALDVSQVTLVDAADQLVSRYPGLQLRAVVGDFTHHMGQLPADGHRLVAFLGATWKLLSLGAVRVLRVAAAVLLPGDGSSSG